MQFFRMNWLYYIMIVTYTKDSNIFAKGNIGIQHSVDLLKVFESDGTREYKPSTVFKTFKELMASTGLPIPEFPNNSSQLKTFRVVDRNINSASISSGSYFTIGLRETASCLKRKDLLIISGYRTEQCFGIQYNDDDDVDDWGYASFMYHCDSCK